MNSSDQVDPTIPSYAGATRSAADIELSELNENAPHGFLIENINFRDLYARKQFKGHNCKVTASCLDTNGERMVTTAEDNKAILWDIKTGRELMVFEGHKDKVTHCDIDPKGGYFVITSSKDQTAIKWDMQTGDKLLTFEGHTDAVTCVAIDPKASKFVVTTSWDKTAIMWDVEKANILRKFLKHTEWLTFVAISRLGTFMITTSADKRAIKWNLRTSNVELIFGENETGHEGYVTSVAINQSRDGEWMVTTGYDGCAIMWDIITGAKLAAFKEDKHSAIKHTGEITSCAIAPSGRWITTTGKDKKIIVWDVLTRKPIHSFVGHGDGVTDVVIGKSGDWMITTGGDGRAIMWDTKSGQRMSIFEGHTSLVTSTIMGPYGDVLVTTSYDKTAILWDIKTGRKKMSFYGHQDQVSSVVVSPEADWIITGSWDNSAIKWDVTTGNKQEKFVGHEDKITAVAIGTVAKTGERFLVTTSWDATAIRWNIQTGDVVHTYRGHNGRVSNVCIDASGEWFITCGKDNRAIQWMVESGAQAMIFEGHTEQVNGAAIGPHGDWMVTCSTDRTAIMWDVRSGQKALTFVGHHGGISHVAIGPLGDWIMTSSYDKQAFQWDAVSGEVKGVFRFDETDKLFVSSSLITLVLLSPEGTVFTVDDNHCVKLWEKDFASARDFNTRLDRPDLILELVKTDLAPIPVDCEFTQFDDGNKLIMSDDNYIIKGGVSFKQGGVFKFSKPVYPVQTYIIPVENIAGIDSKFLSLVCEHAEELNNYDVFDNEVVKFVVMFKWKTFVRNIFIRDFVLTIVLSILFLIHSIIFQDYVNSESDGEKAGGVLLLLLTLFLSFHFVKHEFMQFIEGMRKAFDSEKTHHNSIHVKYWNVVVFTVVDYFRDIWNWLHMTTLILVVTTLLSQLSAVSSEENLIHSSTVAIRSAIAMPLLGTEFLFYLGGLKSTGPLIRMIIKIIAGIQGLVIILAIMVFFFSGSYTVLFQDAEVDGYQNYQDTSLSVFSMLFDSPDTDLFEETYSPSLSKVLMVVFLFFVVVVLLNLLIALMGDIYERVQESASSEATYGLAKLVMEYEGLLSRSFKESKKDEYFPAWLYILKRENAGKKDQTMYEEIAALRDEIERNNEEIKYLKDDIAKILRIVSDRKFEEKGAAYW